jgi:hypothetical protein
MAALQIVAWNPFQAHAENKLDLHTSWTFGTIVQHNWLARAANLDLSQICFGSSRQQICTLAEALTLRFARR